MTKIEKTICNLFKTRDGQKVLEYFVDEYQDRTSAVKGDPYMTYFLEGQRSVVNNIKDIIKECNNE